MLFKKKNTNVFETDDNYFVQIDYPDEENRGENITQHFDFDDAENFIREELQPDTSVTIFVVQKEGRKFSTDDNVFVEELFTGDTYENLMKAFVDEMFNSRNFDEYDYQDKIDYFNNELFPEYLKYFSKDEIPTLPTEDEAENGDYYSVVPMFEQLKLQAISDSRKEEITESEGGSEPVGPFSDEQLLNKEQIDEPDEVDSLEALNKLAFEEATSSSVTNVSENPIRQPTPSGNDTHEDFNSVPNNSHLPSFDDRAVEFGTSEFNQERYYVKFPRFEIYPEDISEVIALKAKYNAEIDDLERENAAVIQKQINAETFKLELKNAAELAKKSETLDNSNSIKTMLKKKQETEVQKLVSKNVKKLEVELDAEIEKLRLQFQIDKTNIEKQTRADLQASFVSELDDKIREHQLEIQASLSELQQKMSSEVEKQRKDLFSECEVTALSIGTQIFQSMQVEFEREKKNAVDNLAVRRLDEIEREKSQENALLKEQLEILQGKITQMESQDPRNEVAPIDYDKHIQKLVQAELAKRDTNNIPEHHDLIPLESNQVNKKSKILTSLLVAASLLLVVGGIGGSLYISNQQSNKQNEILNTSILKMSQANEDLKGSINQQSISESEKAQKEEIERLSKQLEDLKAKSSEVQVSEKTSTSETVEGQNTSNSSQSDSIISYRTRVRTRFHHYLIRRAQRVEMELKMQKFIANGWVSRKNELKENQNGTKRLTFDFAARNNHRDENGKPTSTFFLVELMGKQAEFFEDKISKGQPLLIVGEILERRYEKEGQTQYFRYLAQIYMVG
ncbi:hypothetical protein RyT2_20230 [Pseudolactococcus yaeyamensis]